MKLEKKKAFNQRMGKKKHIPTHQNLMAKGGVVKHFDSGGMATNASAPGVSGPTTAGINPNASGPQSFTGGIANLTGTNDNFQAGGANLTPGTNATQLNTAYGGANTALAGQTALTNTLAPQAASAVSEQNQLAQEYSDMAQGRGPNPALTQLNTTTGQNVANTAALQAGQRGASGNVGLIARQAGQQGAATQQAAAGQGATLEAEQQIAAQQNLANLANNQASQAGTATTALNTASQNEQGILQGANTANNNALVAEQGNINNVNAATAANNQQNNSNVLSGVAGALSSVPVAGQLFSAFAAKGGVLADAPKMAEGGTMPGNPLAAAPSPNAPAAGWAGNYMSAPGGSSAPSIAAPQINQIEAKEKKSASSGAGSNPLSSLTGNESQLSMPELGDSSGIAGSAPSLLGGGVSSAAASPSLMSAAELALSRGGQVYHTKFFHEYFAGGGMSTTPVDAVVSPKEVYLNPKQVKEVVERGADPMKIGHHFPGKDRVKGKDSYSNDVIKTKLEEGGVVIPVHVTTHKKASEKGRKFVEGAVAKHMKRPGGMQ